LYFQDGTVPTRGKISAWLSLVRETFIDQEETKDAIIAVHCLAGLGRAPVLVGIALIEYGMDPHEAILLIRKNRPGALNSQQVRLLTSYRRTKAFNTTSCCIIY
jgi:protein tyrosine phosphatase type 4A